MSDFEYLSVLIAIIVGIGIAHLLLSLGRVLGQTKRLNVSVVHLIWTANVFSLLVVFWWWGINLRELQEWRFLQFYFLLINTSLWCLLAAILYPVSIPPEFDLKAYFAEKRKSFFTILVVSAFVDPLAALILGTEHLIDLGWPYLHIMLACLVGGIAAIRYENERFQLGFAIYWGLSLLLFTLSFQFSVGSII